MSTVSVGKTENAAFARIAAAARTITRWQSVSGGGGGGAAVAAAILCNRGSNTQRHVFGRLLFFGRYYMVRRSSTQSPGRGGGREGDCTGRIYKGL